MALGRVGWLVLRILLFRRLLALGVQDSIGSAIFAVVLRIAALVGAVFDDVGAAIAMTAVGNVRLDQGSPPTLGFPACQL